jgi:hypothetical protein
MRWRAPWLDVHEDVCAAHPCAKAAGETYLPDGGNNDDVRDARCGPCEDRRALAERLTELQRAARFLYLQRNAFGGKIAGRSFGIATGTSARFDVTKLTEILAARTSASPASGSNVCRGRS